MARGLGDPLLVLDQREAHVLVALADGMLSRVLSLGEEGLVDHDSHDSILGGASLALLRGCLEPSARP